MIKYNPFMINVIPRAREAHPKRKSTFRAVPRSCFTARPKKKMALHHPPSLQTSDTRTYRHHPVKYQFFPFYSIRFGTPPPAPVSVGRIGGEQAPDRFGPVRSRFGPATGACAWGEPPGTGSAALAESAGNKSRTGSGRFNGMLWEWVRDGSRRVRGGKPGTSWAAAGGRDRGWQGGGRAASSRARQGFECIRSP